MIRKLPIVTLSILLSTTLCAAPLKAESGFLTDYSLLTAAPSESGAGTDRVYVSPEGEDALTKFDGVMVDQPEIHFSADSEYRGLKPEDVQAIAAILRDNLAAALASRGYHVVEQPGPTTLYLRSALTELYLKKKKRRLMQYTPVGAVVKAGTDALSQTLEKVDIIEMTLEAELSDSTTNEILGAAVLARGAEPGAKAQRMDMDELRDTVSTYGDRLSCRIANAKLPQAERIDCLDPAARNP